MTYLYTWTGYGGSNATNVVMMNQPNYMPQQQPGFPTNMGMTNQPIVMPLKQTGFVANIGMMNQSNVILQQQPGIMTIQTSQSQASAACGLAMTQKTVASIPGMVQSTAQRTISPPEYETVTHVKI